MRETTTSEEVLARYLLGQMSEDERDQIDERYFGDRDFIEGLLVVEDELIDSYVRGELSSSNHRQFEDYFMRSPERQRRVAFARKWKDLVSTRRRTEPLARPSWRERLRVTYPWVIVPLAASLLLAATSLWLGLQITRLNGQLDDVRAGLSASEVKEQELERQLADERNVSSQLRDELARAGGRPPETIEPSGPRVVAFVLNPGLQRTGGDSTRFVIPTEAKQVRLQVNFKVGDYPHFSATLETAEGLKVWDQTGLKARRAAAGRMIILNIPAARLAEQDYVLTISGTSSTGQTESVAEYSFRVVKE